MKKAFFSDESITNKSTLEEVEENNSEVIDFSSDDSIADQNYQPERSSAKSYLLSATSTKFLASQKLDQTAEDAQNQTEIKETKKGKKRRRNAENWIKSVAKRCRNSGKEYNSNSKKKKIVPKKVLQPSCRSCKFHCPQKISEENRQAIFSSYWGLEDLQRQRDFLANHIDDINPKYRYKRDGSNRGKNHAFYFNVEGSKIRVCKLFFKATLAISDRPLRTVIAKKNVANGGMLSGDLRGKHGNHRKIPEEIKESVRQHINLIPRIESHYRRRNSTREYIEGGNTIAELHRDYVADRKKKQLPYANYLMYNYIFNNEFNISFFVPKKDQCETCVSYTNSSEKEKEEQKAFYEEHLMEKDLSRLEKEQDKNNLKDNFEVVAYDLQAVLPCPKGDASGFYYTSKLSVYNLTFYNLKSKEVKCYVWHEAEGNRGVNEIGTCVLQYLKGLEPKSSTINESLDVVFYTDNCCGQQKNRFMMATYQYAVNEYPFINSITHKFLVKGHTQNEGDNVHSVIERHIKRSLRSGPIYTPDQYFTLIRLAKKKQVNGMKL